MAELSRNHLVDLDSGDDPSRKNSFALVGLAIAVSQMLLSVFTAIKLAREGHPMECVIYSSVLCVSFATSILIILNFFRRCIRESDEFQRYAVSHTALLSIVTMCAASSMPAIQVITANLPRQLPSRLASLSRAPISNTLLLELRVLMLLSLVIENLPHLGVLLWIQQNHAEDAPELIVDVTIGSHVLDCLYLASFGCLSFVLYNEQETEQMQVNSFSASCCKRGRRTVAAMIGMALAIAIGVALYVGTVLYNFAGGGSEPPTPGSFPPTPEPSPHPWSCGVGCHYLKYSSWCLSLNYTNKHSLMFIDCSNNIPGVSNKWLWGEKKSLVTGDSSGRFFCLTAFYSNTVGVFPCSDFTCSGGNRYCLGNLEFLASPGSVDKGFFGFYDKQMRCFALTPDQDLEVCDYDPTSGTAAQCSGHDYCTADWSQVHVPA